MKNARQDCSVNEQNLKRVVLQLCLFGGRLLLQHVNLAIWMYLNYTMTGSVCIGPPVD